MRVLRMAPLLALAACGVSPDGTVKVNTKDGLAVSVQDGKGEHARVDIGGAMGEATEKSNVDLSPVAAAYPGAAVLATATSVENGRAKTKVTYQTADAPAKVASFYDARMKAAGASPIVSAQAGDKIARVVVSGGPVKAVAIGIEPQDGGAKLVIEKTA